MLHTIKITNVKIERLQDISDPDCLAEGIINYGKGIYTFYENGEKHFYKKRNTLQKTFAELIDKISGKGTWAKNPWIFAYTFELVR